MKFTTTLILAFAVILVAGFVYLYEIKGGEQRTKEEEEAKELIHLETDSVTAIHLEPGGVELEKADNRWRLVEPIEDEAESGTVSSLLSSLDSAKRDREVVDDRSQHAVFGLAPAKSTIILEHEGERDTIYLGDANPSSPSMIYTRLNSDPQVYLTSSGVSNNSSKTLLDWRSKELLDFDRDEVKRLALIISNAKFEMSKEGEDWRLTSPIQTEADESKISQLISRIEYARIKEFVAEQVDDSGKYGLQNPTYEFIVYLGENNAQKSIRFGNRQGAEYYAHDPARPQVFLVDSAIVNDLNVSLMDLRNKKLADFKTFDADYLEMHYADTLTVVCVKDSASQWQMTSPDSGKAKSWKISNLVSTLAGLSAAEFQEGRATDLAAYGLDDPRASFVVKSKGQELANVIIGSERGDLVYAKSVSGPAVALVKKDEANRLIVPLKELIE